MKNILLILETRAQRIEMSLPSIHDRYAPAVIAIVSSVLVLIVTVIISRLWRPKRYKGVLLPPGSFGLPLIGETLEFLSTQRANKPWEFLNSRVAKYGEVFKTHLIGHATVVARGPTGNRLLFAKESELVQLSWPPSVISVVGKHSLIAKTGDDFKRMRNALMTFLRPEALQKFVAKTESSAKNFLDGHWEGKDEVLVYPLMKHFFFSVVCNLFMSRDEDEDQRKLEKPFIDFVNGMLQFPINFPGTRFNKALTARNILCRQFGPWMEERRRDLETGRIRPDNDLLSYLLSFKDDEGQPLSDEEIKDNILLMLFAGHDTSTAVITMLCKHLAENPGCCEEVWKEQEEIASGKEEGESLNWEDVQRMKVSWRCMQETLRLQPPAQGGYRLVLKDFEYGGYIIPKGWKMHWNINGTHRDAKYFPEPEKFKPSRFEGSGPPRYTFVPFGGGPHLCPSNEFARMEILVLLHHLVRRFKWDLVDPGEPITIDPMSRPVRGLPIRLHRRVSC